MPAIIAALLPVLLNLLAQTPALVLDVENAWKLLTSSTPATPDQQAQIDAALEVANDAVQAS